MCLVVFLVVTALTAFGITNADPVCPKQDGKDPVYIPHEDCTKFWECSNGTPYLFNCSANLHFNPKLNVCDWPEQAGCKGSGEDSSSSSSSESKESGDNSEGKDDDKDKSGNSSSGSSSSSEEGPECPAVDGKDSVYFPHEDCTKFWQCSNGVPYLFNCSANLHFNPKLNVCDWPDQAGCESKEDSSSGSSSSSSSSESKESGENSKGKDDDKDKSGNSSSGSSSSSSSEEGPECPAVDGKDSVYFPHEDCTKFWQCSNGVPYLFNCSANLHFNPKLNVCDWPDQAGCKNKEDSSSGSSSSSSESKESGENSKGKDDEKDQSGDSSSGSNSSSSSSSSESSEEGPECPSVDGATPVYIPHEDCTKFWQCSNGTPYLFDCPANLHFNPKLNVCDWPNDAGCKGKK